MKLAITVISLAARLARWRAERTRDAAIRTALESLAERARQRRAAQSAEPPAPSADTKPPRS